MTNGWAVATGASSGIGLQFALELAKGGYAVLAVARRRERLDALARQAAERGGRIKPLIADLSTEPGLASVLRSIEELGEIELLINNAGIANSGDFLETSLDHEIRAIRLNVEAVVKQTHAALPGMMRRKHELVSRNLARLQAGGFIQMDGREIVIKDLSALAAQHKTSA